MAITITYHPGWTQRQRPPRQPVTPTPPNVGPILSLLLTLAMVAMVAVLSGGGSLATASMVALPVVMVALSLAFATLFMEVLTWLKIENYSRLVLQ